jgi:hypothetical protein
MTGDMALVAWLRCCDFFSDRLERNGDGCCWIFRPSAGLTTRVVEYSTGAALVEPREFALKLGAVRNDMYKFLKVKHRPVRGN